MHTPFTVDAALSVAIALAVGMTAQSLARHLRIPGIVLLLGAGVLLGPDLAGLVRPETLGSGLRILVGYAVAVILFEGGMNLDWKRLRRQARVIQLLLTVGALITAVGAAIAARWLMGWEWRLAIPFGALVIVTGPTVVGPLLRRIKVRRSVETVLEAEGVLIDAIGAVLAVVSLGFVLSAPGRSVMGGLVEVAKPLGFGLLAGLAGGALMVLLLRRPNIVPEGLENVFALSLVLVLFQVCNGLFEESGLMAVTAAGAVMGNFPTRVRQELKEFKEQLTVMLIGLLFVVLAAEVRLDDVRGLGWGGVLTVACLMFVIRPVNVLASTWGSGLPWRERLFLAWIAPRGIVAAAVASLFAQELAAHGVERGQELQALVFSVIACTVVVQGLSGGLLARLLGLRRPVGKGTAILGGNPIAVTLGRLLTKRGESDLVYLENNPSVSRRLEEEGFQVVFGNALEERTLQRAGIDDRELCLALTTNDEVNLLFATRAIEDFKGPLVAVALRRDRSTVNPKLVKDLGASVLFGRPRDLERWSVRLRREMAVIEAWELTAKLVAATEGGWTFPENLVLPLVRERGAKLQAVDDERAFKPGDRLWAAIFSDKEGEARAWLESHGWRPSEPPAA